MSKSSWLYEHNILKLINGIFYLLGDSRMEQSDQGRSNEGFEGSAAPPGGGGGFLDVGRPVNNGHTYVYEPDKSLSRY